MLAGKKLGPNPRIRRQHLSSAPTIDVFTGYLKELLNSPPGARFDISWEVDGQTHTMTLSYRHDASIADWKLYRGTEPGSVLILEHQTNDVPLLYNLISSQTGQTAQISDVEMALATGHGNLSTTESNSSNYMIRNLQKLFKDAQSDITAHVRNNGLEGRDEFAVFQPAFVQNPPNSVSTVMVPSDSPVLTPENLTAQQVRISPEAAHTVDLTLGRSLRQSLLVNDFGIICYPAFQFLLEQEYYKALTNNSPMSIVLVNIIGLAQHDGSCYRGPLPKQSMANFLTCLKGILRKTDVLAQYENGSFVFLLPETELAGAKLFARKVEEFVSNPAAMPGPGNAGLKVVFGIATLGQKLKTLPVLLAGAEQALQFAERNEKTLMSYDDYIESVSTPWVAMNQPVIPPPFKTIDLEPMRFLLSQLKAAEAGVFNYAAWLMFLERDYHRAQRQRRMLLTLLLRLRRVDINSNHPENRLPQAATWEAFRRIEQLQHKGDVLGQFNNGDYALLRPNVSVRTLETLARQIKSSLTEKPLAPDCDHKLLRVGVQIHAVCGHAALPDMLMLHPIEANF
jgi:GGDEF domain-containing protein